MSKHMTIINLACTITKVRKWGEAWKHSAESAQAASAELHRKHKEAERIIETLRANLTQTEAESRVESLRLKAELAVVKDERDQLRVERDALRAQLDAERAPKPVDGPRTHPVKVGEWVRRTSEPYGGVSIGTIGKVLGFAAEHYSIAVEQCWYFKYCEPCDPPGSTHAEPDLTQLHAKGKEAWSDVPNATQWVEDMRGNTEASHDTPEGKRTAEGAVEPKPGDVVRLVRQPAPSDVPHETAETLLWPWRKAWGSVGDVATCVRTFLRPSGVIEVSSEADLETVLWPLSCVEVVTRSADKTGGAA